MRAFSLFAAAMSLATATAAFAAQPAPDDSDTVGVTLSSGIDYSSGAYGDGKDTDILVGLTNVGVAWRDLSFSASVPYLTITGPSFVVVGPGGVPVLVTPQPGSTTTGRSGWGDLNLGATYSLPDIDDSPRAMAYGAPAIVELERAEIAADARKVGMEPSDRDHRLRWITIENKLIAEFKPEDRIPGSFDVVICGQFQLAKVIQRHLSEYSCAEVSALSARAQANTHQGGLF